MITNQQLRAEFERVSGLITNPAVPDVEVQFAIGQFKAIDADPHEKELCLLAIEDTMESRAPEHKPTGVTDEP
jgi:hypothetical protein